MHPVWAQRRKEVLSDCLVSPDVFHQMLDRLGAFVVPYQRALESEAAHHPMHLSLQGLLSQLPRKNAEAIAAWVDVERQVIQDFIGIAPWNHQPLVTVFVGEVAEQWGEPDGIIAFDPSSFSKRGTHAVGVKRQWCGHRGKGDNCQVGVFMGYVSRHEHALLDFRLSLPEAWARDEPRRQACRVPPEVRYHTRQEQCVEMLDAWGEQVPHGWVTGDDELGRHTRFRQQLRERGERYVLGVPCNTTIRDLEAPWPTYQGYGRPPKREGVCDADGSVLLTREDDRESVIRQRLAAYREQTGPVLNWYSSGAVITVDGGQAAVAVSWDIEQALVASR